MKNKHMTDRIEIQECLAKGISFKSIGKRIDKSATTVLREVKLHLQVHSNGYTKSDEVCPRLLKAPFVCNGCEKKEPSELSLQKTALRCKNRPALLRKSSCRIP